MVSLSCRIYLHQCALHTYLHKYVHQRVVIKQQTTATAAAPSCGLLWTLELHPLQVLRGPQVAAIPRACHER